MRKKRTSTPEATSGEWFVWDFDYHECCECGLTHKVRKRIRKGQFQENWTVDPAETRKARRARKKA